MDVAVSELRAHLRRWLGVARDGSEIVVTERGVPVARIIGVAATPTLERLATEGIIAPPTGQGRPEARGRSRPRARRPTADIVSEWRE